MLTQWNPIIVIHLISDTVKVLHTIKVCGRSIQPIKLLLPTQIATLGVIDVLIEQQTSSNTLSNCCSQEPSAMSPVGAMLLFM